MHISAVLPNKFHKSLPKPHLNNRNSGSSSGEGGDGAISTQNADTSHKFKSISICPNVLGLHEPVSFIDYFDERKRYLNTELVFPPACLIDYSEHEILSFCDVDKYEACPE